MVEGAWKQDPTNARPGPPIRTAAPPASPWLRKVDSAALTINFSRSFHRCEGCVSPVVPAQISVRQGPSQGPDCSLRPAPQGCSSCLTHPGLLLQPGGLEPPQPLPPHTDPGSAPRPRSSLNSWAFPGVVLILFSPMSGACQGLTLPKVVG